MKIKQWIKKHITWREVITDLVYLITAIAFGLLMFYLQYQLPYHGNYDGLAP
jgi:DMSO reductase anchor subunit